MANPGAIRAGKAFVEMSLDDAKLKMGLRTLPGHLKAATNQIARLGAVAGGIATAGFGALVATVRKFDEQLDFADRIKIAAGRLQELEHAAVRSGGSVEGLRSGLAKMLKTVGEAGQGNKSAVEALERIGLSVEKLRGLSPERMFSVIADALRKIPDSAGQVAAATDIFGRGAVDIVDTLRLGEAGLAGMAKEARQLGKVMTDDVAKGLKEANDNLDKMEASITGILGRIAAKFQPLLDLAQKLAALGAAETVGGRTDDPSAMKARVREINSEVQRLLQARQTIVEGINKEARSGSLNPITRAAGIALLEVELAGIEREIRMLNAESAGIVAAWKAMPEAMRKTKIEAKAISDALGLGKAIGGGLLDFGRGTARTLGGAFSRTGGVLGALLGIGPGEGNFRANAAAADEFRQMGLSPADRRLQETARAFDLFESGGLTFEELQAANQQLILQSGELAETFEEVKQSAEQLPETLGRGSQEAAQAILSHFVGGTEDRWRDQHIRELREQIRILQRIEVNGRNALTLAPSNAAN